MQMPGPANMFFGPANNVFVFKNRELFEYCNDARLNFLVNMATMFRKIDNCFVGHRICGLMTGTCKVR